MTVAGRPRGNAQRGVRTVGARQCVSKRAWTRRAVAGMDNWVTVDQIGKDMGNVRYGIPFRADIHKLFDAGYVTVTPDYRFQVSRRIKEEFENGRDYYALNGSSIRLPKVPADHPLVESLYWHNEERYLG